jgi:hypothetical protein
LLTESYHPMVGGGENQARTLCASLAEAGVPVTVVTRRWDPMQPGVARVDTSLVHRVGPSGRGHLKKWGLAFTAMSPILAHRHSHRVLIVNGFRVLGIPATLAARCLGMKVILKADSPGEMSGTFFDAGLARFGLSHRSLPVRALIGARNLLLRRADAFVAISSELERELEDHGASGNSKTMASILQKPASSPMESMFRGSFRPTPRSGNGSGARSASRCTAG